MMSTLLQTKSYLFIHYSIIFIYFSKQIKNAASRLEREGLLLMSQGPEKPINEPRKRNNVIRYQYVPTFMNQNPKRKKKRKERGKSKIRKKKKRKRKMEKIAVPHLAYALPADPKRCIFSEIMTFIASFAEAIT